MRKTRRKIIIRASEITGAGLLALDLLLGLGMFRPFRALVSSKQQQFAAGRHRLIDDQARIDRLKNFREAFPEASKGLEAFKRDHIQARRQGFSQAAKLVRRLTEQSGIGLGSVRYKLDTSASGPLECLGLEIKVDGPFSGLLKFAHALETASDFITIQSFNIVEGDNGQLDMQLVAGYYLMP